MKHNENQLSPTKEAVMIIKGESRTLEAGDYRRALAGKLWKGWCC